MSAYLYSKVHTMVHEEKRQDLKNLFYLLSGIPGALNVLLNEFEECIKSQGNDTCTCMYMYVCVSVHECVCAYVCTCTCMCVFMCYVVLSSLSNQRSGCSQFYR